MTRCPNGHESETDDWCDTCGVAIDGAPSAPPAKAAKGAKGAEGGNPDPGDVGAQSNVSDPEGSGRRRSPEPDPGDVGAQSNVSDPEGSGRRRSPEPDQCPNCGTPRVEGDVFCEVCGLDHATGKLPKTPNSPKPVKAADPAPVGKPSGWIVVVETDRDFFDAQEADGVDLEFPASTKAREVTLVEGVATIGRRSDQDGWYPTIDLGHPLDDPAVSRKHAELRPTKKGWQVVDVGSTNGTVVAGEVIAAGTPVDLADGDHVNVGVFTRLTLKKSPS